ncbi:fimbria/pilus outer membrane usher protein [Providencia stuartii]|nr:fimbria/pilus outer membrane usher protein [Providencia stuartii]
MAAKHSIKSPRHRCLFLTRQGQFLYKFSVGESSPFGRSQRTKPRFIAGEASYGLFSRTSLFGGSDCHA